MQENTPQRTAFEQTLQMQLYRTLDAIMPPYRELFARHDLTEQQWRVVRVLWDEERVANNELAKRCLLPAPSLVGIVDRLEKKELVQRIRSLDDRRIVHLVLTAKGRALGKELRPLADALQQRQRDALTDDEWATLSALLAKCQNQTAQSQNSTTAEKGKAA